MSISLTAVPHRIYRLLGIERRRGPRRDRPVMLAQSRIFILPTRSGLGLGLIVLLLLTGATNYASSPLFMMAFLIAATAFVSLFHCYRNLAGLSFIPGHGDSHCFAGQDAVFTVQSENPARRPRSAVEIRLGDHDAPAPLTIPPGTSAIALSLPTERRGRLSMPVMTVSSRYPFGLFRAWSRVRLEADTIVYPRPAEAGPPPPTGSSHDDGASGIDSGGQDDFIGYRDHQATDSPRHVDWKAVARGRAMMVKLFASNSEETLTIDWHATTGGTEARIARLCRWLLTAEAGSRRYALRLPDRTIDAARGEAHKHRCLAALALYGGHE